LNRVQSDSGDQQLHWSKTYLFAQLMDEKIVETKSGANHNLLLSQNGKVFAFGYDPSGQCGLQSNINIQMSPIKLDSFNSEKVKAMACGSSFISSDRNWKCLLLG
jgi:alpha-tubulin suppressor-like RCC1 family protein